MLSNGQLDGQFARKCLWKMLFFCGATSRRRERERAFAQMFSLPPFSGTLAFVVSLLLWPFLLLRARSFFHVTKLSIGSLVFFLYISHIKSLNNSLLFIAIMSLEFPFGHFLRAQRVRIEPLAVKSISLRKQTLTHTRSAAHSHTRAACTYTLSYTRARTSKVFSR